MPPPLPTLPDASATRAPAALVALAFVPLYALIELLATRWQLLAASPPAREVARLLDAATTRYVPHSVRATAVSLGNRFKLVYARAVDAVAAALPVARSVVADSPAAQYVRGAAEVVGSRVMGGYTAVARAVPHIEVPRSLAFPVRSRAHTGALDELVQQLDLTTNLGPATQLASTLADSAAQLAQRVLAQPHLEPRIHTRALQASVADLGMHSLVRAGAAPDALQMQHFAAAVTMDDVARFVQGHVLACAYNAAASAAGSEAEAGATQHPGGDAREGNPAYVLASARHAAVAALEHPLFLLRERDNADADADADTDADAAERAAIETLVHQMARDAARLALGAGAERARAADPAAARVAVNVPAPGDAYDARWMRGTPLAAAAAAHKAEREQELQGTVVFPVAPGVVRVSAAGGVVVEVLARAEVAVFTPTPTATTPAEPVEQVRQAGKVAATATGVAPSKLAALAGDDAEVRARRGVAVAAEE